MIGSKRHTQAASLFGLLLVCIKPLALAEPPGEEVLPGAFFEFLAEWDDENGEWQDPAMYEDSHWQVLDQTVEKTDE